jgi:hypothetical protein
MRKASQRRARSAAPKLIQVTEIPRRPGDKVRWRDRAGVDRRDVDDEHAEVVLDGRLYGVRKPELRPG